MEFNWQLHCDNDRIFELRAAVENDNRGCVLEVWHNNFGQWYGTITDRDDGESIEYSHNDIFNLMQKMQQRTERLMAEIKE